MWDDIFQKLIRRNFLVEISPQENFGKRNYWVDIYHRGIKSPPQSLKVPHFPDKMSASRPLLQKSQILHFLTTSLILGLRRLKVLHFLGKPLLPSLKVQHFPGNISVSRPLFPASQSATFPRQIYDFSTLALSSRSLEVLHFLRKSLILGLWPSLPSVWKCYISKEIYSFGTLALSSRRLKVLRFLGKPPLPSLEVTHFPEKHLCF